MSFWNVVDCITTSLVKWNETSATATKIYNAMAKAQAAGEFDCTVVILSGTSIQATLTCAKLRTLGYHACMVSWPDNQIRVCVSWEP